MKLAITTDREREVSAPPVDDRRLREKRLFRTINRCVLGSFLVGAFFAVVAAFGGMKSQGVTLDRTGSALGVMAMFLGVSVVLIVALLIRFAWRERRFHPRGPTSSLGVLEPSNA